MNVMVDKNGLTEEEFLASYKPSDYERPSVTVDLLVFALSKYYKSLKILLIQRGGHPYLNYWALPGGFVNIDESAEEAAYRELKEETNLDSLYLEQLYTMSEPKRDPRMRVIDIAYLALIQEREVLQGDDANDAKWFDVKFENGRLILTNEELDKTISYRVVNNPKQNGVLTVDSYTFVPETEERLAFDHAEIVLKGLERLKNKVVYTDIAFNLVPEVFTLPDLQRVYEVILGKKLYKTNFRDAVKPKIKAKGKKIKTIVSNNLAEGYKFVNK